MTIRILCLGIGLISGISLSAQEPIYRRPARQFLWQSISTRFELDVDKDLVVSQMISHEPGVSRIGSIQWNLGFRQLFTNDFSVSGGYKPTFFPNREVNQIRHRLYGNLRYRQRLRSFRIYHSLTTEWHFPRPSKFRFRTYYTFSIDYRNKKIPLKIRPYLALSLYHYLDGRPLQYYDEATETKIEKVAPNGLHAARWRYGIRLRPIKQITISLYWLQQKEFNTRLFGGRDINSLNPRTGNIRRRFFDFNVLGYSISLNL